MLYPHIETEISEKIINTQEYGMEKKNNKLFVIIAVCLVAVAVILSVFLLRGCGEENNESNTDVSVNTEISETVSNTDISTEISTDEVSAEESTPEESLPVDHTHEYADTWSSNETDHWHECECGDKSDIANHAFGEWETTKEATEDATGSKKHTCSVCGYEETATIPMLSHTHSYSKESSSNETDHWYECACGDKSGVTSHTYGDWTVTKEATEETEGSKYHTCSGCGYKETVKIPVLSHTHKYGDWKNNATSHWKECSCGDKSEMSAHGYGDWVTIKDATCTETGTKKHTCTNCSHSETTIIVVIAHSYGDWKNNATSHWKECSCGDKSQLSSHTYGAWTTTKEATCTETGTKKHTCTACSHSETTVIVVIAHVYGDWKYDGADHWKECECGAVSEKANHTYTSVVTPPTESEQGYTTHTCSKCSYSYVDSYTDPVVVSYSEGLQYRANNLHSTCIITGIGTCKDTDLKIPPVIDGYKVIEISSLAFSHCTSLTSITIPNSVTTIGDSAFYNCTSLTSVTIPDGVTSIGWNAFSDCTSLTSVIIPNSVTTIGSEAFSNCGDLTYNTYDNAYYLGNSSNPYVVLVKTKNTNIASCIIHPNTRIIYNYAFASCANLTNINIPERVTTIGKYAFYGCTDLVSVDMPDGVSSVAVAFYGCNNLTYNTYDNAYYLGNSSNPYVVLVESKNDNITRCTIHPDTKVIANSAFAYCANLTNIIIPDGVVTIGDAAFLNCTGVTGISIPNSVTTIGRGAFEYCTSLTDIDIPDGVTVIDEFAFSNCTRLTNVIVPNGVTIIGDCAFAGCTALADITIPDSVIKIGGNAFNYCISLARINIPDGIALIDGSAFCRCYKLTNVTIPDSVTFIHEYAFYECTGLTKVTIPSSVTTIYNNAFGGCANLTDVYYSGSESDWNKINIAPENTSLINAKIHFNS